jgi:hypothetical protein
VFVKAVHLGLIAGLAGLAGCAGLGGGDEDTPSPSPWGPTGIPPQLRAGGDDADMLGATAPGAGGAMPGGAGKPVTGITPEEDIVWTDPDDWDAEIPELDALLAKPVRRGPWEESETVAKQRGVREGKSILIWFTDSRRSPMCKAISSELFSIQEFDKWAEENLVRLRVDLYVGATTGKREYNDSFDEMDEAAKIADYVERLKKRYKVLGCPTLVMLTPQGEVIERYRGYKRGNGDFVWGQLKSAVIAGNKSHESWRKRLEKRGYRDWTGRRKKLRIFAKLLAYRDGEVLLVEPGGQRLKTHERRLSDGDRLWIEEEKRKRGR